MYNKDSKWLLHKREAIREMLRVLYDEQKDTTQLLDEYYETIKELKDRPGITIPDEAIRAAILTNPNETDEDDIIDIATLIKPELLALVDSVNKFKKAQAARDKVNDRTLPNLAKWFVY